MYNSWAGALSKPFGALRAEPLIKLTILFFNDIFYGIEALEMGRTCTPTHSPLPLPSTVRNGNSLITHVLRVIYPVLHFTRPLKSLGVRHCLQGERHFARKHLTRSRALIAPLPPYPAESGICT